MVSELLKIVKSCPNSQTLGNKLGEQGAAVE